MIGTSAAGSRPYPRGRDRATTTSSSSAPGRPARRARRRPRTSASASRSSSARPSPAAPRCTPARCRRRRCARPRCSCRATGSASSTALNVHARPRRRRRRKLMSPQGRVVEHEVARIDANLDRHNVELPPRRGALRRPAHASRSTARAASAAGHRRVHPHRHGLVAVPAGEHPVRGPGRSTTATRSSGSIASREAWPSSAAASSAASTRRCSPRSASRCTLDRAAPASCSASSTPRWRARCAGAHDARSASTMRLERAASSERRALRRRAS